MTKLDQMQKIRDEIINLKSSPLYSYRTQNNYFPVIGEGSHDAKIMFIGEAPGKNEAETARPFCGRSGKLLDEFLTSINLPREKVYITNIVKDRPQGNRDPTPNEIELYAPFLDRQIGIIQPRVIVGLGRFSGNYIMSRYGLVDKIEPISRMHGKVFETAMSYGTISVVPLYHPAVAIYNQHTKTDLLSDFQILKQFLI